MNLCVGSANVAAEPPRLRVVHEDDDDNEGDAEDDNPDDVSLDPAESQGIGDARGRDEFPALVPVARRYHGERNLLDAPPEDALGGLHPELEVRLYVRRE